MEMVANEVQRYEDQFKRAKGIAQLGRVNSELISENDLDSIIKDAQLEIDVEFVYRNLKIEAIELSGERIAFRMYLPKLFEEKYQKWQVLSVPFVMNNKMYKIKPELTRVGISVSTGYTVSLSQCQYENPVICANAIRNNKLSCVEAILRKDSQILHKCSVDLVNTHGLYLVKVNENQLLFSTLGTRLLERCYGKMMRTYYLQSRVYDMLLKSGCTHEETDRWVYILVHNLQEIKVRSSDQYLLQNVTVQAPGISELTIMCPNQCQLNNLQMLYIPKYHS